MWRFVDGGGRGDKKIARVRKLVDPQMLRRHLLNGAGVKTRKTKIKNARGGKIRRMWKKKMYNNTLFGSKKFETAAHLLPTYYTGVTAVLIINKTWQ